MAQFGHNWTSWNKCLTIIPGGKYELLNEMETANNVNGMAYRANKSYSCLGISGFLLLFLLPLYGSYLQINAENDGQEKSRSINTEYYEKSTMVLNNDGL